MPRNVSQSVSIQFDTTKDKSLVKTEMPMYMSIDSIYIDKTSNVPTLVINYTYKKTSIIFMVTYDILFLKCGSDVNFNADTYEYINTVDADDSQFSVFFQKCDWQGDITMKKIVLVDDCKDFLKTLAEFLESSKHFEIASFSNPEEALSYMLDKDDIYSIITDYEMPKMNGFQLIKSILGKKPNMKIILMSGHDTSYIKKVASSYDVSLDKVYLLDKLDILKIPDILLKSK